LAHCRDQYLHNTQPSQETDIHAEGFEPTIPASECLQTHALDCVATGISKSEFQAEKNHKLIKLVASLLPFSPAYFVFLLAIKKHKD
jgi:hypothetical protein